MVKLDGKGMEKYFGVGVTFYIISSPVQFLDNCMLLTDIGKTVQPVSKIFFIIWQVNVITHDL